MEAKNKILASFRVNKSWRRVKVVHYFMDESADITAAHATHPYTPVQC